MKETIKCVSKGESPKNFFEWPCGATRARTGHAYASRALLFERRGGCLPGL